MWSTGFCRRRGTQRAKPERHRVGRLQTMISTKPSSSGVEPGVLAVTPDAARTYYRADGALCESWFCGPRVDGDTSCGQANLQSCECDLGRCDCVGVCNGCSGYGGCDVDVLADDVGDESFASRYDFDSGSVLGMYSGLELDGVRQAEAILDSIYEALSEGGSDDGDGGDQDPKPQKSLTTDNSRAGMVQRMAEARGICSVFCSFSYSESQICCSWAGAKATCCPTKSGNGPDTNNPDSQGKTNKGPAPEGKYKLGKEKEHDGQPWFAMHAIKSDGSVSGYMEKFKGRNALNLHAGRRSDGCVTVLSDVAFGEAGYPRSTCFDKIVADLREVEKRCPNKDWLGEIWVES